MNLQRRGVLKAALTAGAAMTPLCALAQSDDDAVLASVNPELRPMARGILQFMGDAPPMSQATLADARRGQEAGSPFSQPLLADVPHERRMIAGAAGAPEVPIYVVNAKADGARPAILHTHGGGFVAGTAESAIPSLQRLCKELDCVAVSVDYRLAPETTYRGSVEDNYAGLKWLHANAAALGADPARIAVMGESAGGGHAALLAIAARDRGEVPVVFQSLIYPMLDDRTGSTRMPPPHVGRLIWPAASNRYGWQSFLGATPGRRSAPRDAVPARVENLAGLPPAWIGVGSIDLFCDEDVDYAQRLNAAGVPTELLVIPGAFHGFDMLPGSSRVAAQFNAAKLEALRRGLGIVTPA